jgi:hypothetical protein
MNDNSRSISRRLSKLRFTQDVVHVKDFVGGETEFKPGDVLEKVAVHCGITDTSYVRQSSDSPQLSTVTVDTLLQACLAYVHLVY